MAATTSPPPRALRRWSISPRTISTMAGRLVGAGACCSWGRVSKERRKVKAQGKTVVKQNMDPPMNRAEAESTKGQTMRRSFLYSPGEMNFQIW